MNQLNFIFLISLLLFAFNSHAKFIAGNLVLILGAGVAGNTTSSIVEIYNTSTGQ
jgi:hypothetical protein